MQHASHTQHTSTLPKQQKTRPPVCLRSGRLTEALEASEQALVLLQQALLCDHPDTASASLNTAAAVLV